MNHISIAQSSLLTRLQITIAMVLIFGEATFGGAASNAANAAQAHWDLSVGPPGSRLNHPRHDHRSDSWRQERIDPDRDNRLTIPHWSGSFTYQKLTYKYTLVGTDPKRGSATTIIPTVLIPLRLIFADGTVLDASTDLIEGRTAIQAIVDSPIFRPHDFKIDGTDLGKTQYGDALQRAEFWDSVSKGSRDYHVILGQPKVDPVFEVFVPSTAAYVQRNSKGDQIATFSSSEILYDATLAAIAHADLSPQMLPIVIWGNVDAATGLGDGASGLHGAYEVPGGLQTYIAAAFHSGSTEIDGQDLYRGTEDINSLSREVALWLNDPFNSNYTPGWNSPISHELHCQSSNYRDLMEVANVGAGGNIVVVVQGPDNPYSIKTDSGRYHPADAAVLDYFTRIKPSRSLNGQYSFFGSVGVVAALAGGKVPSPPCTGHVEVQSQRFLEFPRAVTTQAFGINNYGWIVGDFWDASAAHHGFLYDGRRFTQLDYPDAVSTVARKVNDTGQIVGLYTDAAGLPHGFSWSHGKYRPIDFPGSLDGTAVADGINSWGDIVGRYDASVEITHGFIYQNGRYRTLDSPFAAQTVAKGINDRGQVVGFDIGIDPNDYASGFVLDGDQFTRFDFPGASSTFPWAVNNKGMQAGTWYGIGGRSGPDFLSGYVTIYGYPYEVPNEVFDLNDKGEIVGNAVDANGRVVGYVATLPR